MSCLSYSLFLAKKVSICCEAIACQSFDASSLVRISGNVCTMNALEEDSALA